MIVGRSGLEWVGMDRKGSEWVGAGESTVKYNS